MSFYQKLSRLVLVSDISLGKFFSSTQLDIFLNSFAFQLSYNLPKSDLNSLIIPKLNCLLKQARMIPFWKQRFQLVTLSENIENFANFNKLPIISRSELVAMPLETWSNVILVQKEKPKTVVTSGSTGHPLRFYGSYRRTVRIRALYNTIFRRVSATEKPRIYNFGLYNHRSIFQWCGYNLGNVLENDRGRKDLFTEWQKNPPDILYTSAAYLKRIFYWAGKEGVNFYFRAIIYTAQGLKEEERFEIKHYFRCPILSLYGSHETGVLGVECPFNPGNFHTFPECHYIEVVDDAGNPLPFGMEGKIVCTYFESYISPFIRYELGDRGALKVNMECPCGRESDYLIIQGRTTDTIKLSEGREVVCRGATAFLDKILADKILQYQFEQRALDELIIRMVPKSNLSENDVSQVYEKFKVFVGYPIKIQIECVEAIIPNAQGKILLLINKIAE